MSDGNGATVTILPAADDYVAISPREERQWAAWLEVMGSPDAGSLGVCAFRDADGHGKLPRGLFGASGAGSLSFHRLRKLPGRLDSALIFGHESRHSPRVSRDRHCLRMRRGVSHPLDQARH